MYIGKKGNRLFIFTNEQVINVNNYYHDIILTKYDISTITNSHTFKTQEWYTDVNDIQFFPYICKLLISLSWKSKVSGSSLIVNSIECINEVYIVNEKLYPNTNYIYELPLPEHICNIIKRKQAISLKINVTFQTFNITHKECIQIRKTIKNIYLDEINIAHNYTYEHQNKPYLKSATTIKYIPSLFDTFSVKDDADHYISSFTNMRYIMQPKYIKTLTDLVKVSINSTKESFTYIFESNAYLKMCEDTH